MTSEDPETAAPDHEASAGNAPFHLFVVEDDTAIRQMVSAYLEKHGLVVTAMSTAEDLLRRINRLRPDLVVLDVGLPGMSGLDACRQLRAEGDAVPVILLTARSEEVDRVLGLEMGADDYLSKPFSARELLARIRAVLRRAPQAPGSPKPEAQPVRVGPHLFIPATRHLEGPQGVRPLSSVEFALLAELLCNPSIAISRERLVVASHSRGQQVTLRAVDTAIMRLRRLVEPNPAQPRYIQTVRGAGYVFVPDAP